MEPIEKPEFCTAVVFVRVLGTSPREVWDNGERPCDIVGVHELRDGRKLHRSRDRNITWVGDK